MAVSIEEIKKLKELTGLGLTDAKKALVETEGDFDKALEALRKKGLTKAEKKGDREFCPPNCNANCCDGTSLCQRI